MPRKNALTIVETPSSSLMNATTDVAFFMTDAPTNANNNQITLAEMTLSFSWVNQLSNQPVRMTSSPTSVFSQPKKNPSKTP
jgi:hypothetical protein